MTRFNLAAGTSSLRNRVMSGAGLIIVADLYTNGIRLIGNLILTRLLYPEAFGLMLIVNLVFTAFEMLSDLGIRGAIISRDSEVDRPFIQTAWVMSIIRGTFLSACAFVLAQPIADYYQQPQLVFLIWIAAIAPAINGFASIAPILLEKQVRFFRVLVWRGIAQTTSLIVVIVWLLLEPSVYVLAANGIIAALIAVPLSYLMFENASMSLAWDKSCAWEIFRRARWIFAATALTFLARQGDSLIVSHWTTIEQLGVFSIAVGFAKLVETVVDRLSYTLLFPVYSEIRNDSPESLQSRLRKIRLGLFALAALPVVLFAVLGRDFVALLYDPRFINAGWMLEVMSLGSLFYAVGAPIISIPLAFGDAQRHMWLQGARFGILLLTMIAGASQGGLFGLVAGIAIAQLLFYPVLCLFTAKYKVRDFPTDILFVAVVTCIVVAAWSMRGWPVPTG